MRFIKTYEEFRFEEEEDTDVLDPEIDNDEILIDKPVDDTLLGGPSSYPRPDTRKEVVNIKDWKVY